MDTPIGSTSTQAFECECRGEGPRAEPAELLGDAQSENADLTAARERARWETVLATHCDRPVEMVFGEGAQAVVQLDLIVRPSEVHDAAKRHDELQWSIRTTRVRHATRNHGARYAVHVRRVHDLNRSS